MTFCYLLICFISVSEFSTETQFSTNARDLTTGHVINTTVSPKSFNDDSALTVPTVIGIVIAITILLSLTLLLTIAIVILQRKAAHKQANSDSSYSTPCRQQLHPQSLHTPNDLYDHIQLSPLTGQTEFISKTETDNTNNLSPHHGQHSIIPSVDKRKPKSAQPVPLNMNTYEQPTYAVVNKVKKHKHEIDYERCSSETTDGSLTEQTTVKGKEPTGNKDLQQSGALDSSEEQRTNSKERSNDIVTQKQKFSSIPVQKFNIKYLYTVVQEKTHASKKDDEKDAPPIPQRKTEELYTAAIKKPKGNLVVDLVESPPIPPHTVEKLYTAVMKKPKARETDDEVEAPPVPPHTVEKLYTAVLKN